jgi:hypothetical protein
VTDAAVLMLLIFTALFAPIAWSDWHHRGYRPFDRIR